MEKHIRLLDCTLRDGGHINKGQFGETVIKNTIERLVEARIDIIEVGFLWNQIYGTDTARYYSIEDVKRILPENHGKSKFSLMADFINLEHIEPCDGTIEIIRLAFKRSRWEWGVRTARILMNKGYKVIINPVNNNVYTDKEYIECLEKVNELHPYGFSIVDTFGVMRVNDLAHRYYLVENNLEKDISIGIHLHENLGLAYSLAQKFLNIASPTRKIVIDGSLLGMGRVPGNLCIEQIMEHLNEVYGTGYITEPVYDAIDDYIAPIKRNPDTTWGYATPYALSAKFNLHRTYAEYLMGKQRLKTKDIQRILMQIEQKEAELFNEDYVENLYLKYMNVTYDDTLDLCNLSEYIQRYENIVVVAPGSSICAVEEKMQAMQNGRTCFIAINFCPTFLAEKDSFIFLTNAKRFDSIKQTGKSMPLIITSNLMRDIEEREYVVNYNSTAYFDDEYCDDSTLMLLGLLSRVGVKKVQIAGFDGFKEEGKNFFDKQFDRNRVPKKEKIKKVLLKIVSHLEIDFMTKSEYQ